MQAGFSQGLHKDHGSLVITALSQLPSCPLSDAFPAGVSRCLIVTRQHWKSTSSTQLVCVCLCVCEFWLEQSNYFPKVFCLAVLSLSCFFD